MKGNIIEGILVFIGILLIGFLVWNQINIMNDKVILTNEYEFNAVKLTNTENTITMTTYMASGSPTKYVETIYMENGKITKIINEEYYDSVNNARQSYNWTVKYSSIDISTISINKNVIIYTNNNPEISTDDLEVKKISTNQEFIDYAEEHIDDMYTGYTRVY